MPALVYGPWAPPIDPNDPLQYPAASVRVVGTGFVHRASLRKFRTHVASPSLPLIVHCLVRLEKAALTEREIVCPRCAKDDEHDVTALVLATPRTARCSCGKTAPSDAVRRQGMFTDLGPDSDNARNLCVCGSHRSVHDDPALMAKPHVAARLVRCGGVFAPIGARPFDLFYCGCSD